MAENSNIAWTDHTHNPWIGCTKVSPGCKNCYAETMMDKQYHKVKWGPQGLRIRTSKENWKKPGRWNKDQWFECMDCGWRGNQKDLIRFNMIDRCLKCDPAAHLKKVRQRVFCASLADVFEAKQDQWEEMNSWRADLFKMIEDTQNLDWLLLTKRPENIISMVPDRWCTDGFPRNIWLGVSTENQDEFDSRVPILESVGRAYRPTVIFISAGPLLSSINMAEWLIEQDTGESEYQEWTRPIDWVIAEGESGPKFRPMEVRWAQNLHDQCKSAGIPFFMKQDCGLNPGTQGRLLDELWSCKEFPEVAPIDEFPF